MQLVCDSLGAQVKRAIPGDAGDLFYLSPKSIPGSPARGGVPILFPQFAARGNLNKHGFARNVIWTQDVNVRSETGHRLAYSVGIGASDHEHWPHAAELRMEAVLEDRKYSQRLAVKNKGGSSFAWSGGFHPYFLLDDLCEAKLFGLEGIKYFDKNPKEPVKVSHDPLCWDGSECEKLYSEAPPLCLKSGGRELSLVCSGLEQWMVWNPGTEISKSLSDLPIGDWNRFVCIEPVSVQHPIEMQPGATHVGSFSVSW